MPPSRQRKVLIVIAIALGFGSFAVALTDVEFGALIAWLALSLAIIGGLSR